MLGKEDCPFATAGRTEIEPLARERPKVVVTAFKIGTMDTRDALEIVAARREAFAQLLDTFKAVPAVGGGVLLVVLFAEVGEVAFNYSMELVAATRNIPVCHRARNGDRRAHIIVYLRSALLASDRRAVR